MRGMKFMKISTLKEISTRVITLCTVIAFVSGCVKTTRPVEPSQLGDENKNCQQLAGEVSNIENRILENMQASDAQVTLNIVILGVTLFVFWPAALFTNLTPYKKERDSLEARKQRLSDFYLKQECSLGDNKTSNIKEDKQNVETNPMNQSFNDMDECVVTLMKDRPKEVYEDVKRLCSKKVGK